MVIPPLTMGNYLPSATISSLPLTAKARNLLPMTDPIGLQESQSFIPQVRIFRESDCISLLHELNCNAQRKSTPRTSERKRREEEGTHAETKQSKSKQKKTTKRNLHQSCTKCLCFTSKTTRGAPNINATNT